MNGRADGWISGWMRGKEVEKKGRERKGIISKKMTRKKSKTSRYTEYELKGCKNRRKYGLEGEQEERRERIREQGCKG